MQKGPNVRPGDLIAHVTNYTQWLRFYPDEIIDVRTQNNDIRPSIVKDDIGLINSVVSDGYRVLVLLKNRIGWLHMSGNDVVSKGELK